MNLCGLLPKRRGLLIGLATGYISISSMIPQGWLIILKSGKLTLSNIMFIWMVLAIVGFIVSLVLWPWHTVMTENVSYRKDLVLFRNFRTMQTDIKC